MIQTVPQNSRAQGQLKQLGAEGSNSESTIYKDAVAPATAGKGNFTVDQVRKSLEQAVKVVQGQDKSLVGQGHEISSSDDDLNNTSDESAVDQHIDSFLFDVRQSFDDNGICIPEQINRTEEEPKPSTSRAPTQVMRGRDEQRRDELEQQISTHIREVETAKGNIYEPKGRVPSIQIGNNEGHNTLNVNPGEGLDVTLFGPNQFMRTAMMDEDYLVVAAHVDESLERRIRNGEYVDFSRLIPRDRVQMQQDNRIELVNQNGHLSCTTVSPGHGESSIGSFPCWEQAFRMFSNIYTRQYPQRASELIQYNHVIHTASMNYAWNNVYAYDIDFRLHMSRHPQRSWSVILQQAWNLRLQDRQDNNRRSSSSHSGGSSRRKDICFCYNVGKCTYGSRCKFDHHCGICGKHGHGAHNCRRTMDKYDDKKYDRNHDRKGNDRRKDRNGGGGNGSAAVIA